MDNYISQLEKWLEKRPFLKNASALPMRIHETVAGNSTGKKELDLKPACDEFAEGIPLFFVEAEVLPNVDLVVSCFKALLEMNTDGLPEEFTGRLSALNNEINESNKDIKDIVESVIFNDTAFDIPSKDLAGFLVWAAVKASLTPYHKELETWAENNNWQHEYCPVCGGRPAVAELVKTQKGKIRNLVCSQCDTHWHHKRLGCPYCGNVDQEKLSILEAEEEDYVRLDVCDVCDGYIKTVIKEGAAPVATEDWASVHMDVLAKETKYLKKGGIPNL